MRTLRLKRRMVNKGDVYKSLTVLGVPFFLIIKAGSRFVRRSFVTCQCECGEIAVVSSGHLLSSHTTSCGCVGKERRRASVTTHGMSSENEYRIWLTMIARCHNPNSTSYPFYGEKGIQVCERWRGSFENFYVDMGPRPSKSHSLDRFPNGQGDYEPGNVRWATIEQQQWSKDGNVDWRQRISRSKQQVTESLDFRIREMRNSGRTIESIASELGFCRPTIRKSLKRTGSQKVTIQMEPQK